MNCNICKHYNRSEYPYHCELAKEGNRFCNDCLLGVSHYEPKDDCADEEINCEDLKKGGIPYTKVHDKYVTIKEYNESVINPLRKDTNWKATIGCWFLLLLNFSLLTFDIYYSVTQIIDKSFSISTAVLIVSFVCLFYVTLKYFLQIAMPKRKY